MQILFTTIKNPRWSDSEKTMIDCEITTTQFGNQVLPFTATATDCEPHGGAIFTEIISGKHGAIAEYVPEVQPEIDNP